MRTAGPSRLVSRSRVVSAPSTLSVLAALAGLWGCGNGDAGDPALVKGEPTQVPVPEGVPVPPADGPKLAAVAHVTPIFDRPWNKGQLLGYLHAGARVARAEQPFSTQGCAAGWFPVRPRGFVCAADSATTDMNHPTLVAMAIQPKLDEPLPYTYARTTRQTTVYKVDRKRDQGVVPVGTVPGKSGMAIVGSWSAADPEGKTQRLAMMSDGRFVPAADLSAAESSDFKGVALDEETKLPLAFVVKKGVRAWALDGNSAPEKRETLDYHQLVRLTGRFRTVGQARFWATVGGNWVRNVDVTVVVKRHALPEFVKPELKWVDISVVTGTMVLYEGKRPVFVTLVSVGHDRLGEIEGAAVTARGEFRAVAKHVTALSADPKALAEGVHVYDVPWAVELSSGQMLHAVYWHDRFGIEHGPGHIQLSPADALRVWHWIEPGLPENWHGVTTPKSDLEHASIVNVRK